MSQLFNSIKVSSNNRSTFDLSHHQVTTSDFGYLIPITLREMVPGDDFTVKPSIFCRLAPLAVPTYGRITCRVHHFFVPNRIMYPKWDAWITKDKSNYTIPPSFTAGNLRSVLSEDPMVYPDTQMPNNRGFYAKVISNFGLNPKIFGENSSIPLDTRISAFPFLAYYRIFLDYFADPTLTDHPSMIETFNSWVRNGGNISNLDTIRQLLQIRYCCFKKDYFTSARQQPQDGSPSQVKVPIDFENPGLQVGASGLGVNIKQSTNKVYTSGKESVATSNIGSFTVEAMRAAQSLQRYLERNNFVGTKLINRIFAHFGIQPEAERLDMAEYIGGSSFPIQIADVTSHSSQTESFSTDGLGYQAGKGIGSGSDSVRYHAKEHGFFISLMSILPDTGYYQGMSKLWTRGVDGDSLDYFHPEFENLGFQEVLNHEVFIPEDGHTYQDYDYQGIFGFQPQYADYKFQQDVLAGDFLTPSAAGTFYAPEDAFHLFRKFNYVGNSPLSLNLNFVECNNWNNDFDRIFQFTNNEFDHFYFNIDVDVKATRPMASFGEPALFETNQGDGKTVNLPYGGTRL